MLPGPISLSRPHHPRVVVLRDCIDADGAEWSHDLEKTAVSLEDESCSRSRMMWTERDSWVQQEKGNSSMKSTSTTMTTTTKGM